MIDTRLVRTGVLIAITLLAVPASAQEEKPQVVEVKEVDNAPVIWGIAMMILLGLMALGANAIPSKRGHQD